MAKDNPHPTEIKLHKPSKMLTIKFDDDAEFEMSCEYLRVHSPSAEVQGHGLNVSNRLATMRFKSILTMSITPVFIPGIRSTNSVRTRTKTGKTTLIACKPREHHTRS
jgi:DUF971 family protein